MTPRRLHRRAVTQLPPIVATIGGGFVCDWAARPWTLVRSLSSLDPSPAEDHADAAARRTRLLCRLPPCRGGPDRAPRRARTGRAGAGLAGVGPGDAGRAGPRPRARLAHRA